MHYVYIRRSYHTVGHIRPGRTGRGGARTRPRVQDVRPAAWPVLPRPGTRPRVNGGTARHSRPCVSAKQRDAAGFSRDSCPAQTLSHLAQEAAWVTRAGLIKAKLSTFS